MKKIFKNPCIYIVVSFIICLSVFSGCNDEVELKSSTQIKSGVPLLTVHYIDVGQGDCTFIELPNGKTMLIDAGNPEDAGNISNYIESLGHTSLNYIVATHPHADHIGGMADVISQFDADAVYLPDVSHTSIVFENMVDIIYERNIPTKRAKRGVDILDEKDLNITLLAPSGESYSDLNEYSAVVKITYKDISFLFMGDSGHFSENEIMQSGEDITANVLKCGHHGSSTSSCREFAEKVSPEYAIISCGVGNSYGHPHVETIELFESLNSEIFRTDTDGTIVATSDGENISVKKSYSTKKENAPPEGEAYEAVSETDDQTKTDTAPDVVYITKSGKRYHRDGCDGLRYTKIPISKSEAIEYGYTACKGCKP